MISRPQIPNSTRFMAQARSTEGLGERSRDASWMFHYYSKTHGCVCVCACVDPKIGKNVEPGNLFEFRTLLGGGWPAGP